MTQPKYWLWPAVLTLAFVLRVLFFAGSYAGIEHDSGWYLGVAKNLAHRGIYASYTNTTVETAPGPQPSIHHRPIVQDEQGYTHFPASVTVGPGYLFPEAALLWLYGDGWWQYRLWPVLGYAALLILSFGLLLQFGPLCTVAFALWLWSLPQFTVQFAYEALSEHIALLYTLLAFMICATEMARPQRKLRVLALGGVLFALSILTKPLSLLTLGAFGTLALFDLVSRKRRLRGVWREWGAFAAGAVGPLALFQLFRFLYLVVKFGMAGYRAANEDVRLHYLEVGSGLSRTELRWELLPSKLSVWIDLGFRYALFGWVLLLVTLVYVVRRTQGRTRLFVLLCAGAIVTHLFWYLFIATDVFARYTFQPMYLAMLLASAMVGTVAISLWNHPDHRFRWLLLLIPVALLAALDPRRFDLQPLLDATTARRWLETQNLRGKHAGFPPLVMVDRSQQQEVVNFFSNQVPSEDRVYYLHGFILAELSTLVDKVFFPLTRYPNDVKAGAVKGRALIAMGPFQMGPTAVPEPDYVERFTKLYCDQVLFRNDIYQVCRIKGS